jgi:riboflavin synthase
MFTGIIEELGVVEAVEPTGGGLKITVGAEVVFSDLKVGDSINLDGVCLTVVGLTHRSFTAEAVSETLRRTTLGVLRPNDRVNLERPLRPSDRLGGHLVLGHVDSLARILSKSETGGSTEVRFELPVGLAKYFIEKGSVAVDGVSLTVAELSSEWFSVAIIPYTATVTTLVEKRVGAPVNIEADIIGKYVERLLRGYEEGLGVRSSITAQWLREKGY